MPLIQRQVVDAHAWLTMGQFADIVAIAEMTPGPIAINAATFVGIRVAGLAGALAATAGCVLPSCLIVTALAWLYYRFRGLDAVQGVLACLRPAVVAMIAAAGLSLTILAFYGQRTLPADLMGIDWLSVALFAGALALLRSRRARPVAVMLGAGVLAAAARLIS